MQEYNGYGGDVSYGSMTPADVYGLPSAPSYAPAMGSAAGPNQSIVASGFGPGGATSALSMPGGKAPALSLVGLVIGLALWRVAIYLGGEEP